VTNLGKVTNFWQTKCNEFLDDFVMKKARTKTC